MAKFVAGPRVAATFAISGDGRTLSAPPSSGGIKALPNAIAAGNLYYEIEVPAGNVATSNYSTWVGFDDVFTAVSTSAFRSGIVFDGHIAANNAHAGTCPTISVGDVVMLAKSYDGKFWAGKNGTWFSGDPAAGMSPLVSANGMAQNAIPVIWTNRNSTAGACDFKFRFSDPIYPPPDGFSLLSIFPEDIQTTDCLRVCEKSLMAPPASKPSTLRLGTPISGARNLYFGGHGKIIGTVKEKGAPINTPVYRRVRLYRDRDGLFVAETWSDPATGAYAFVGIDPALRYTALSFDHTGNFRAVVADNLTPEMMP